MVQFHISLPDTLGGFVRAQIDEGRYASVEDYVRTLIEADQQTQDWMDECSRDPRIEALVIEGVKSGSAGPMSKDDWDALKRPYLDRMRTSSPSSE
jgi:putative addiction module CopG family antidote